MLRTLGGRSPLPTDDRPKVGFRWGEISFLQNLATTAIPVVPKRIYSEMGFTEGPESFKSTEGIDPEAPESAIIDNGKCRGGIKG